jgi:nitrilase
MPVMNTSPSAAHAVHGEGERGNPHLEPKAPRTGVEESPAPRSEFFKIAALQMVSTPDVDRNLEAATRLIAQAAAAGAGLVALPEYFCLMGRRDDDKLRAAEAPGDGPIQRCLSAAARRHGVWLVGGTLPLRSGEADRVFNACLVSAPDGRLAARYDKLHLFSFDNGREHYDEGGTQRAGDAPVAFQAGGCRVGLSICYDLRFPELYRALMRPPCDLIVVPSAFTATTGRAHWELLLRARAVENQCYVLAPAQGGAHENGRRTWGHSLIADPWGEVLAVQAEGEGVVLADLDPARIAAVRAQLPALGHRRL